MNDIPTPRTDLAKLQFIYDYSGLCDFACQLERELAQIKRQVGCNCETTWSEGGVLMHHEKCPVQNWSTSIEVAKLRTRLVKVEKERNAAQLATKDATNKAYELDHQIDGFRSKLAEVEKERDEEKRWRMEKNETANVFMNQVKKLQNVERELRAYIARMDTAAGFVIHRLKVHSDDKSGLLKEARDILASALSTNAPEGVAAQPDPTQPWREVVEELRNLKERLPSSDYNIIQFDGSAHCAIAPELFDQLHISLYSAISRAEALLRKEEVKG